ncbi:hypothetical protein HAX54_016043 [Datura stramonium]|uniref:RRM domain-containing protein n=1 Tax=Datura stramonium TaxID=4076 RepID=A0ABS8UIE5_DATST|nr:hypothetical protein [Datura stramonium]
MASSVSSLHLFAFVRNVALSEFDQLEDDVDAEEEPNFSPDLKLFVGNLPFSVDSAALAELFERAGNVEMVEVIYDKLTGRSRGFGFVTMSTKAEEIGRGGHSRVNPGPAPNKRENSSFGGARGGRSENSSLRYGWEKF